MEMRDIADHDGYCKWVAVATLVAITLCKPIVTPYDQLLALEKI